MPEDTTQLIDGMLGAYTLAVQTHDPKHIREYDRKRVELQLRLDRAQRERDEARAAWKAYDGHREGCEFCAECGDAAEIADGYRASLPSPESKV